MSDVDHKKASRYHFKERIESRLGIDITKSAMKAIKKKIITGEIPLWGFKDSKTTRTKHLYVIEDITYVIVYDRARGELVTIYPYDKHIPYAERVTT